MKVTVSSNTNPSVTIKNYSDIKPGLYRDTMGDLIIVPPDGPEYAVCVGASSVFSLPLSEEKGTHNWRGMVRVTTPITITLAFNTEDDK